MDSFSQLLKAVGECTPEQKLRLFEEIRKEVQVHKLEKMFNARAEIILEAISRAGDLTQRGVCGLIAETSFALDIVTKLSGWEDQPIIGDQSFDSCLVRSGDRVRVQVKLQRKEKGVPKKRGEYFVVEVQRTRSGQRNGEKTRPYRFSEFDLIAVCMEPSCNNWQSFLYASAKSLTPDVNDKNIIATFQSLPAYPATESAVWTPDLGLALDRVVKDRTET